MITAKKVFRAEAHFGKRQLESVDPANVDELRHYEIIQEITALKRMLDPQQSNAAHLSEKIAAELRSEIGEAAKLKVELDAMYDAIGETKTEIAALHHKASGEFGAAKGRAAYELDEIVSGTEKATEQILTATEEIDQAVATIGSLLPPEHEGLASDVHERVVSIFEACNFQDLTGQRITKVVSTLNFVEERIVRMMEIWGGIDTFKTIDVPPEYEPHDERSLLNGPARDTDDGVVTQDDIDALFA
ncbi:protein phosphatase CheZ [Polycladidibacter stylochi]|uniref:protein phosphatase CheZ n=1 Tax=Polycladidibacter stylochi TaxID=1807766 RepID=UPI00083413C7|nr:protein phosphatase CheZ [Pseudovibrio stylochi]